MTLKNRNAMQKNQMFVFLTSGPTIKKQQDQTTKQKTSQIVNNNNPAQNFFSIAQFPTKKQTPFFVLFIIKKIYTSSISQLLFLRISPEKETVIIIVRVFKKSSNNMIFFSWIHRTIILFACSIKVACKWKIEVCFVCSHIIYM